jgi:hypothetical protein
MRSNLLESVFLTEFEATESDSSVDMTKAKYSTSGLSKVKVKGKAIPVTGRGGP